MDHTYCKPGLGGVRSQQQPSRRKCFRVVIAGKSFLVPTFPSGLKKSKKTQPKKVEFSCEEEVEEQEKLVLGMEERRGGVQKDKMLSHL